MRVYLLIGLIALTSTYVLTPLIRRIAIRVGAVTKFRARDVHTTPTPRMGGIAMLLGLLTSIIFAWSTDFLKPIFDSDVQLFPILIGAVVISFLGALDDIFDLDWMLRLGIQIAIASFVCYNGVQLISFPIFGLTVTSYRTSFILSVLVIVAVMNAVNFIDGLDGLASGVIMISSGAFFLFSYLLNLDLNSYSSTAALLSIGTSGICAGFLFHNFKPAVLFMGDSGSMLLGYLIACSSIIVTGRMDVSSTILDSIPAFMPILIPFMILILPFLDMITAILRRLIRRQSPFEPDKEHIHHKMLSIGHSQISTVLILWGWTFLLSLGAVIYSIFDSYIILLIETFGFFVILLLTFGPRLRVKLIVVKNYLFK